MKDIKQEEWVAEIIETDCEIWNPDIEGNSREEVIKGGMEYAKEEGCESFRIGRKIPVDVPSIDVDRILECAYEDVYDKVGECAEGFLDNVTKEQQNELEEQLNDIFYNWIKKHKLEPNCFVVEDIEDIQVNI